MEGRRLAPSDDMVSEASREALVLPFIFLTVSLLGGFRMAPDGTVRFIPPPLITLVLAVMLLGLLVRSGALAGERLMSAARRPLENLSGVIVLATLFAAAAQVFNAVTPEAGLLRLIFNAFFFLLLWNTLAAQPDATRLHRSLFVVLGSAFVAKYILLAALYEPEGGLMKRVATTVLEGVTLGTVEYQPHATVTGYVCFFTVGLYFVGVILLPRDPARS